MPDLSPSASPTEVEEIPDLAIPTEQTRAKSSGTLSAQKGGVDNAIVEPFSPFSHQDILVQPYEGELGRDIEFQEHLHKLILDLVLEFHAWSTSRPILESAAAGDALFAETQAIMERQEEQGMLSILFETGRLRLLEFISRFKAALAALTGF